MSTTGSAEFPYPNSTDIPDGPAAFLALAQRNVIIGGAGIGYTADATSLAALITNGDAFTGLSIYHAAADAIVRYNGSAFKLGTDKIFATVAARDSWTTTYSGLLQDGSAATTQDTDQIFRYNGSAWVDVTTGLFPIIPTSVAGTGVTLGASGKIICAATASASFNGAFTSVFDNYLIQGDAVHSGASDLRFQLRGAGTTITTSTYDYLVTQASAASTVTATANAVASWGVTNTAAANGISHLHLEVSNPALAVVTTFIAESGTYIPSTFVPSRQNAAGANRNVTAYDGGTITVTSGTFTGSIRIYGFNNL